MNGIVKHIKKNPLIILQALPLALVLSIVVVYFCL